MFFFAMWCGRECAECLILMLMVELERTSRVVKNENRESLCATLRWLMCARRGHSCRELDVNRLKLIGHLTRPLSCSRSVVFCGGTARVAEVKAVDSVMVMQ